MTHRKRSAKPARVGGLSVTVTRPGLVVISVGLFALGIVGGLALSGQETNATPPMARADGAPVVVELFTSQGCYSCPPAEAMLAELAHRDGIVALEHHVDYWDSLVYGSAGRWKDVFS